MATVPRSFVGGHFFLNLDGVQCGFLKSVDGGDISAEVITEPAGPSAAAKKHIGQPKYEDFALRLDLALDKRVYDWISSSWNANYQRKNGAVVTADANFAAVGERDFFNALITETTIPALDASSKEPAYLTVKFAPEYTRTAKASGKLAPVKAVAQKQFLPSNFRLELDGLDCSRVSRIDSFTVALHLAAGAVGDARDVLKEPGRLDFPNLRITLAESFAKTWTDWFEDFVVKGNNDDSKERSGAIVFLSPDRKSELGRVTLHNVGIFALRHPADTAADQIRRIVAELYCERMELSVGPRPAVVAPSPPVVRPRLPAPPDVPHPVP